MNIKKYYLSINCNTRRGEKIKEVKYIVVSSSKYLGLSSLKNRNIIEHIKYNEESEFSCHYIIGTDGKVLNIIPEKERAILTHDEVIDSSSISIMLCLDTNGKYTKKEINTLSKLIKNLKKKYSIKNWNIIMEYDVNLSRRPKLFCDERILFDELKK